MKKQKPMFRSDATAQLVDSMGGEGSIVRRARVSTAGSDSIKIPTDILEGSDLGLLKWLYREGHGTPFEGVEFEIYMEIPIFVSRQVVKHRISSINEESGRYKELKPVFYRPDSERKAEQVGKTGNYEFVSNPVKNQVARTSIEMASRVAWSLYEYMIKKGVSKEVARMVLPVNLYSSMYFKTNLRSLLNFVELRTSESGSHPQYEIELVGQQIADMIKEKVPNVWQSFVDSGYKAV